MPELPEVETIRRDIEPYLAKHEILRIKIYNENLRYTIPNKIHSLQNEYVFNIKRRAKYLFVKLSKGWIIIHFGMTGKLKILKQQEVLTKHDHIDIFINNGYIIRYTDPRRFGFWLWTKKIDDYNFIKSLGLEPFSQKFNGSWLFNILKNKNKTIKSCLMDAKIITGIGNIYSNEILFRSKILPYRLAYSINQQEAILLAENTKKILSHAIAHGGTTLQNFYHINGQKGTFTKQLQVYGRKNKPCFICKNLIKSAIYNQRISFFCLTCQI